MAKKPAKKGGDDAAAGKKGGKAKLIIILVIVLLVLGGGGAAAWFFFIDGNMELVKKEKQQDLGPRPLIYFRLAKPVTATFSEDQPATHLRVGVVLATRDPIVIEALELHTPMLRNDLLALLSSQKYDELLTPEGKEVLREQIHELATSILVRTGSPAGIENVFFDELVMQ
jgi:flagellar FliL protein